MSATPRQQRDCTGPAGANFWARDSTAAKMRELTIWASVYQARRMGLTAIPTVDAIFDVPPPSLPRFQLTEGGPWQVDWPMFRRDQTRNLRSPEEAVYLGVTVLLRRQKLCHIIPTLLKFFPESGPYGPREPFDPLEVERFEAEIVRHVIRLLCEADRARMTPEEQAAEQQRRDARKARQRGLRQTDSDQGYAAVSDRDGAHGWPASNRETRRRRFGAGDGAISEP